ncbi:N-acetyltransferase [Photobacterium sanctipauli]|uniref:N-acetyltransferase n=1 Tax=Photobacterium sanctipauli TaxID=1342794 RepID=A0A2T3NZI7_9GAMM|nr:GNAT family N-acetyltransferase [Photobacterium sanctipauli]PSW21696.1 N-acetyltransferase [Photobacterium sanctipauli]
MDIAIDKFEDEGVLTLLEEHLADMYATSPPESVHALDVEGLKAPSITFWSARVDNVPLGCIAMKQLDDKQAEIKSMRTSTSSRGQGVATQLLAHLIVEAKARGYQKLSLETGSMDFFKPARRLYQKHGFTYCEPFGDYSYDPNSLFMELYLSE